MRRYQSLRGRREFAVVARRGRVTAAKHVLVFSLPAQRSYARRRAARHAVDGGAARLKIGIVITKKLGTAVERNRLRRRCKAILDRATLSSLPTWYLVQFRPSAAQLSFVRLREELSAALERSVRAAGEGRARREPMNA